ncbi:hypothetical protein GNE08_15195 [Trichormus variabilis ARAD]|uniref:Uncharacterized protein n=1 Tax=Trichormus variabilis N2B TaxID=2681315 RepID=A0ABR6SAY7_ANAVA|nr:MULTISPECIES: hypothetical protein [Nostocaceae]MBC1215565.1 hypothetical protein [Trichormus variabilis ARAD]MBC1255105.1 hypothetical protein [Trichormus variabilis V5]MBC1267590.1 hypothetical protein [Trichormus variabilis FSR]MBC1303568.1 hypothetical protein [Trichormus variabilis N2B]MBC1313148.1 hypothetical protein [Trichormus variabilis PNB]
MVRGPCCFQSYSPLYLVLNLAESICGYKLCICLTHLGTYNHSISGDDIPPTVAMPAAGEAIAV